MNSLTIVERFILEFLQLSGEQNKLTICAYVAAEGSFRLDADYTMNKLTNNKLTHCRKVNTPDATKYYNDYSITSKGIKLLAQYPKLT